MSYVKIMRWKVEIIEIIKTLKWKTWNYEIKESKLRDKLTL